MQVENSWPAYSLQQMRITPRAILWRLLVHEVTLFKLRFRLRKWLFIQNFKNDGIYYYVSHLRWKNMAPSKTNKYNLVLSQPLSFCQVWWKSLFLLLFYRYGENVVEVHHNTKWTCLLVGIFATTVLAAGEKVGCLLAKYTVG